MTSDIRSQNGNAINTAPLKITLNVLRTAFRNKAKTNTIPILPNPHDVDAKSNTKGRERRR